VSNTQCFYNSFSRRHPASSLRALLSHCRKRLSVIPVGPVSYQPPRESPIQCDVGDCSTHAASAAGFDRPTNATARAPEFLHILLPAFSQKRKKKMKKKQDFPAAIGCTVPCTRPPYMCQRFFSAARQTIAQAVYLGPGSPFPLGRQMLIKAVSSNHPVASWLSVLRLLGILRPTWDR